MNTDKEYYWLNKESRLFLERGYLNEGVSPEERIIQIADNAEKILKIKGFSKKFQEYMVKGYYSLATPVWTNFGNDRGYPSSCFGSYISDNMESILYKSAEIGMMSKGGGGTSAYFGELRPRGSQISIGGESSGPTHFMEIIDSVVNVVSQSSTRRGNCACYLPVEHDDILEFLDIRSDGHKIQELSIGVTITNKWMKSMIDGDKDKRKIWSKIIKKRYETGYPYVQYIDNCNSKSPKAYKEQGRKITHSNLCSEIMISDNETESFVCVLSSINLLHWDKIKETDAVETLTYFLDAVCEEFITKSKGKPFMEHAYNFAKRQRALGLGVLGWHSLLQSKMIEFESMDAKYLNQDIFQTIQKMCHKASKDMALQYGEPEMLIGHGLRNITNVAIAPTTSSSFILGQVSPSIEPLNSNYFTKRLAKGNFTYRNPHLKETLKKYDKDNDETWNSILLKGGSVQHLKFLTDQERGVFKTFGELSQKEIVIQAAQRQKYIDQGQSLNLMISPKTPAKEVSELMIEAWQLKVKALYYQRSTNPAQELSRSIMDCTSCEG